MTARLRVIWRLLFGDVFSIIDPENTSVYFQTGSVPSVVQYMRVNTQVIDGSIDRQITNLGQPFDDGEHIIYVNGADKNASTELGLLMHDFFCTDPNDMHYKELADKVRYFKEDEKGVQTMCKVIEDMRNEAAQNAVEKYRIQNAVEMLADGLSIEKVAQYTHLAIERVKELATPKVAH